MRVRMITNMAGPDGAASAGQIIDVEQATASQLVGGGYAQYVDKVEAAVVEPPEKAVMPRPTRKTTRKK